MSFMRALTKKMSIGEWYSRALNDSYDVLDRRLNINISRGEETSKPIGDRELKGVIKLLNNANKEALREFSERVPTKEMGKVLSSALIDHSPSYRKLFNLIEAEQTLFSQDSHIVDLYDYLMKLNSSLRYLTKAKNIDSNSSSLLKILFQDIINLVASNKYKIDFISLTRALGEAIAHNVFDENIDLQQRLNHLALVLKYSENAFEVLCQTYNIKN